MVQKDVEIIDFQRGTPDEHGNLMIRDRRLRNRTFDYLFIGGPSVAGDVILENVCFDGCSVVPGEFGVFSNVRLIDVEMSSLILARRLRISSSAEFNNLTLKGTWQGAIWIGPTQVLTVNREATDRPSRASIALNLEKLRCADLTVLGVPLDSISFDPSAFVGVRVLPAARDKQWGLLEGWVDATVNYVLHFNEAEGLFSLPRDARERLSASTGLKKAESLGLIEIVERDRTGRSDDEDS